MDVQALHAAFLRCEGVSTDSRRIRGGEMFIALRGETFDGNAFALQTLEAGARYAVVEAGSEAARSGREGIIVVEDTLEALRALARCHRESLQVDGHPLPVIGLTGTNGKTTTKELIRAVLATRYRVSATEGNLNNDIGVPLSLLAIRPGTELAVIEMGASHPDDIARLVSVCEPDYGLITNVGRAHLLGFGSFEGVKRAKGQLYDYLAGHGGTVFLHQDDPDLTEMARERGLQKIVGYGVRAWQALLIDPDAVHPFLRMAFPENTGSGDSPSETLLALETHLVGAYNAANVCAALAIGLHFGVPLEDALTAVADYVPANRRSQMQQTARNTVIVDAYNANPTSMAAALDSFAGFSAARKAVLLGNMGELGADSQQEHRALLRRLAAMSLDRVLLVGPEFRLALDSLDTDPGFGWFPDSEALTAYLAAHPLEGYAVLVKGSRSTTMEKTLIAL